ncbi:hypothetical protein G7070_13075 [Propioniciclava coleopterorum]|uniref:Uncharacterized protein n=1 Tax=Propioniciclava coleopterorum TaxID=2714937 RepID=A0A6G7Y878_9ACTN|nr:hypothetical protein [Propioniciclava coleopterorum]QIK73022.1 hypothetical protein G7070_13075 [Propioniciclava coleopterorum]
MVRGAVDSPWREAAAAMGVPLAPRFEAAGVTLTPVKPELPIARPDLTPIIAAAAGALAAVLALVGVVVALLRRRPKLHGSLAIARQGATVREFVLDAPTVDLARAWPGAGLTGTLRPATSRDGVEAVRVVARAGGQKVRTVLRDDEAVNVGELTLRWTAQRTRTLEMVNEGL